jgi:hypothetical protein
MGMRVKVSVCHPEGWETFGGDVADGSDRECYALPKDACRAAFWSGKLWITIEPGRALIWEALPANGQLTSEEK